MTDHPPYISVLMTSYNREKYIAEAIESVLASTYTDFELIILDDCSTDNTVAIARTYADRDGRIRLVVNEGNLRQFQNRNKAASLARGEYIYYSDSDDTLLPDGLTQLVAAMQRFPEASFGMQYRVGDKVFQMEPKEAVHHHFFTKPFLTIGPGGTIMRRTWFLSIGGYPTKYEAVGDMYFNLKAACHSPIVLIPFEFMNYREHAGQELNNPYSYLYNGYLYLMDALHQLPLMLSEKEIDWLGRKCRRRFLVNCTKYFLRTRNWQKTRELIRRTHFGMKDLALAILN
jgi:glycosyltransferase involved in cell wall biosynthesis